MSHRPDNKDCELNWASAYSPCKIKCTCKPTAADIHRPDNEDCPVNKDTEPYPFDCPMSLCTCKPTEADRLVEILARAYKFRFPLQGSNKE